MNSQKRCNVLMLAKGFPPEIGGVETYSERIAQGYLSKGCEVTVITRFPVGETAKMDNELPALKVINVGNSTFQPLVLIRFLLKLVQLLAAGKRFDLVHASTWRAFLPVFILKLIGVHVAGFSVITVHGREILQTHGKIYRLMSLCFRQVDGAVFISEFSRLHCEAYCSSLMGKAIVAWNGISWPEEPPKTEYSLDVSSVKVLTVCQLTKRKNVASLINVVKRINSSGEITIKLKVAGAGAQREALEAQIRDLGLQEDVILLGMIQRRDLPKLYREADLFVHPHSHSHDQTDVETFCLAVADGMAFGVPTISGRDGAPSEYLVHGYNGMIINGADEDELYGAIRELVAADDGRRKVLGQTARCFALNNFSWAMHVGKVLDALGRASAPKTVDEENCG